MDKNEWGASRQTAILDQIRNCRSTWYSEIDSSASVSFDNDDDNADTKLRADRPSRGVSAAMNALR